MPNFRRFYLGYVTSHLGTAMSVVAVAFAVLDNGGSAADLGYVATARIVPQVIFILGGGVLADRLGRRPAMLGADALRGCAQGALAGAMLLGRPQLWLFMLTAAVVGTGDAFFEPALGAITVEIAPREELASANALRGFAGSATAIAGPALAGVLVAATGPALVIAVDAASYLVSAVALALLRLPGSRFSAPQSVLRDMGDGWREFASRPWLWIITVQFALFNLITWAPYLVLGPVLAHDYLGGARAWGIIQAASGVGAMTGGLAALGRKPRRPLVTATLATFGYPVPCLMLALHAHTTAVAAGAFAAGLGGTLFMTFCLTTQQQQVPEEALARADAFVTFGAFGVGTVGLALAGPVAGIAGVGHVLGFGAAWAAVSSAVVVALPAIRRITWRPAAPGEVPP